MCSSWTNWAGNEVLIRRDADPLIASVGGKANVWPVGET